MSDQKIYVAGHRGLVGSAIVRALENDRKFNVVTASRQELDLTEREAVDSFFAEERPNQIYLAAAKVGGILANDKFPATFIHDNLVIQTNVIDAAYRHGASKLLFMGSSCIYPKYAPQPMKEEHLLTGPLEPTNEWYAIAKIAGIKMGQAYRKQFDFDVISLMPTNLYGPGDNFDLESSHVLPALIRKFHDAKIAENAPVQVWGSGSPRREFLHVDDLANASVFLMENYSSPEIINVGVGKDIRIKELAELIQSVVGHTGPIEWDPSKPDGTPRKLLDVSKIKEIGWEPSIELEAGIRSTYDWFLQNRAEARLRSP